MSACRKGDAVYPWFLIPVIATRRRRGSNLPLPPPSLRAPNVVRGVVISRCDPPLAGKNRRSNLNGLGGMVCEMASPLLAARHDGRTPPSLHGGLGPPLAGKNRRSNLNGLGGMVCEMASPLLAARHDDGVQWAVGEMARHDGCTPPLRGGLGPPLAGKNRRSNLYKSIKTKKTNGKRRMCIYHDKQK